MKMTSTVIGIMTAALSVAGCASSNPLLRQIHGDRQVINGVSASNAGITIMGTRPFTYLLQRKFQDSLPAVLVIKLKDTELGRFRQAVTIGEGPVEVVVPYYNAGAEPWSSEIHVQFRRQTDFRIVEQGNNLVVAFNDAPASSPSPVTLKTEPESRASESVAPAPPQANGPAPKFSVPPSSSDYVIGPEDVLEILVWKNDDLSRIVTVRPDGNISLPLIGEVRAAGLTPEALRDDVVRKVSEYQIVPGVSVIVKEVNSYNIYILGEVSSPGKYQLKSNATLLQAISLAGGFTPFAAKNDIKVLRKIDGQSQEKIFKIRYKDIVSNEDPRKNIVLEPGDTIIVP